MAWSGTLAAPVGPDDNSIAVTPAFYPIRWGKLLIIDAAGDPSIVAVRGATDGGRVLFVDRGLLGTERLPHAAGVTVAEYSAAASTGGAHPNLATHDSLGLATQAELDTHAAGPHGGGAHPDLATHDGLGLATDAELTTHAGTAHGTQPHAISGPSHTGTLDHSALANQTVNQHHNQDHASRHASAGADPVAPSDIGAATTGHNHDASYEASGAVSTHAGAADPHTAYLQEAAHTEAAHTGFAGLATQSELDAHAATSHGVTAHGSLTGVTGDQHHAQLHAAAHLSGGNDAIFAETVPTTAAFGDTAAQGADASKVSKLLHRHGMPANPVTAHEAAGDPHTGYVREADANWTDLTDGGATSLHSHAGGGSSPDTFSVLTATQANSTTTPAAVTGLTQALIAGTYLVKVWVAFRSAATTTGIEMFLHYTGTHSRLISTWYTLTTGGAAATGVADQATTATAQMLEGKGQRATNVASGTMQGVDTANADQFAVLEGIVVATGGGNLEMRFRSEVAASAVTMMEGTTMTLTKVI